MNHAGGKNFVCRDMRLDRKEIAEQDLVEWMKLVEELKPVEEGELAEWEEIL